MILTLLTMLLTAYGCDVEYNDETTGLNPGCNFAGVCVQITDDMSICVCCAPEKFGRNICGANWVCDPSSLSFQCFEFSSDDCSKVNQYLLVNLEFLTENENEYQEPDIVCDEWPGLFGQVVTSMLRYDIADHVQSVASNKGWPGAIKSRGACGQCTSEVPCAAGDELITSGISFALQVDLNLYYDSNCAVDFWICGEVVECDANWDYGHSAWFSWRKVMSEESYIDDVNNLLRMDFDEDAGLGKSWNNTKIAAIRELLTVITNNNVILTQAPTGSPTAHPTGSPTVSPTDSPTASPTDSPTATPTESPTASPSEPPTAAPTESPTESPTASPSEAPTTAPTESPTESPTSLPSMKPTPEPSMKPTPEPSMKPTPKPSMKPTPEPTNEPTIPSYPSATPFYRYYHSGIVDHFYTRNWNELGWGSANAWIYERQECRIFGTQISGTVPLYRYYGNHDHFYTTNIHEIGTATPGQMGHHNFRSEGVAGYCFPNPGPGLLPLYRFMRISHYWNHFYKCSSSSTPGGYNYEGIACYLPA